MLAAKRRNPDTPASRRRAEVETRRAAESASREAESADRVKQDREEVDRVRRVVQRGVDERAMRWRHQSMRFRAGFLSTRTQPRVYWLPWEMMGEEGERDDLG